MAVNFRGSPAQAVKKGLNTGTPYFRGGSAPLIPAMTALTDVSGLVIDFDASDTATISATGALVNTWTNKGSYGGSAAATSTNRPSTRVWNNDLNATAAFHDLGQNALAGSVRTGLQVDVGNVDNRIYQYSGATAITDGAAPESGATDVVTTLRGEAALAYNYVNGQTRSGANGAPTYGAMGVWRIAGDPDNTSSRWNGAISEIAAYNRTLTLDEQALVEGFLAWKWGFQANLFSGNEWATKDPRSTAKVDNVVCWGNSFTENAFLASNLRWPAILQTNTGRKVSNQGIGGQTSTQIAARANVDVKYTDRIRIIEAGTNGADATFDVQTDIAGMVAYKPVAKYIILGVVRTKNETVGTAGYIGKTATNAALLSTYGTKFIDIMELAVELQAPDGPFPDAVAYANRVIQDALLLDTLHWTATLMAYIELWVRQKMTALNY
jgi:hypothetical protein